MKFIRCRNCNVYFQPKEGQKSPFCSYDCSLQYQRCPVCGRYYLKGEGADSGECSPSCRDLSFPHIPLPDTINITGETV